MAVPLYKFPATNVMTGFSDLFFLNTDLWKDALFGVCKISINLSIVYACFGFLFLLYFIKSTTGSFSNIFNLKVLALIKDLDIDGCFDDIESHINDDDFENIMAQRAVSIKDKYGVNIVVDGISEEDTDDDSFKYDVVRAFELSALYDKLSNVVFYGFGVMFTLMYVFEIFFQERL